MLSSEKLIFCLRVAYFPTAVEQLLIPALRGRPVALSPGHLVTACSPEAARAGVQPGLPVAAARRRCCGLMVLPPHPEIYTGFAAQVSAQCRRYSVALAEYPEECYGDATGLHYVYGPPLALARSLQQAIRQNLGLTATVGLGRRRLFAHLAAVMAGPGRLRWLPPHREATVLAAWPVSRLPGLGERAAALLNDLQVRTVADLRAVPRPLLTALVGSTLAARFYVLGRGYDPDTFQPADRPTQFSHERWLPRPLAQPEALAAELAILLATATMELRQERFLTRRVELTLGYQDQHEVAAWHVWPAPTDVDVVLLPPLQQRLAQLHRRRVGVSRLGLQLAGLVPAAATPELFPLNPEDQRQHVLDQSLDGIRARFGTNAIHRGLAPIAGPALIS